MAMFFADTHSYYNLMKYCLYKNELFAINNKLKILKTCNLKTMFELYHYNIRLIYF